MDRDAEPVISRHTGLPGGLPCYLEHNREKKNPGVNPLFVFPVLEILLFSAGI
jgi:hypothetical protein